MERWSQESWFPGPHPETAICPPQKVRVSACPSTLSPRLIPPAHECTQVVLNKEDDVTMRGEQDTRGVEGREGQ